MRDNIADDTMSHESRAAALLEPTTTVPTPTLRSVLSASGPAILNNVAAPLAAAAQLALLGHSSTTATERVAAFTAINAVTAFSANILNFLVVVTMSRVGHALGARRWGMLGSMVLNVLLLAFVAGVISAGGLMLARKQVLAALSLSPPPGESSPATDYLPAALVRVPALLLLRAASSVLVGYQRVGVASMVNTALAAVDTVAFYVVLHVLRLKLHAVGYTIALTCASAAALSVILVLCLPPDPAVRVCSCRERAGAVVGGDRRPLASLACDSVNVLIRSLLLHGSLLALTVSTARLGTSRAPLNAHAVVLQLWMITSYFADGFADAGTMFGSRLLGAKQTRDLRRLTLILAVLGLAMGSAASALLFGFRDQLIHIFSRDEQTIQMLKGPLWTLLCGIQPVNALVFVYDGLLYATQSFRYIRNALCLGVLLVFSPALGYAIHLHTLTALWTAKALLNSWRCLTALLRIHAFHWPTWTGTGTGSSSVTAAALLSAHVEPLNAHRAVGLCGHATTTTHADGHDVDDDDDPHGARHAHGARAAPSSEEGELAVVVDDSFVEVD